MIVAIVTNTPEPEVWERYTIGMIARRLRCIERVMPFFNPFVGTGEKPLTGEAAIVALRHMGF